MEKQQIIHNKWSDLGIILLVSQYDFDGWIDVNELEKEQITANLEYKKYRENDIGHETMLCRPKSLKGIENNNGWNVLKGIKNEITHEGDIWILNKYGNVELWLESQFLAIGYATHWKPIIKPDNLPLY